jgi:hypothetical protein
MRGSCIVQRCEGSSVKYRNCSSLDEKRFRRRSWSKFSKTDFIFESFLHNLFKETFSSKKQPFASEHSGSTHFESFQHRYKSLSPSGFKSRQYCRSSAAPRQSTFPFPASLIGKHITLKVVGDTHSWLEEHDEDRAQFISSAPFGQVQASSHRVYWLSHGHFSQFVSSVSLCSVRMWVLWTYPLQRFWKEIVFREVWNSSSPPRQWFIWSSTRRGEIHLSSDEHRKRYVSLRLHESVNVSSWPR